MLYTDLYVTVPYKNNHLYSLCSLSRKKKCQNETSNVHNTTTSPTLYQLISCIREFLVCIPKAWWNQRNFSRKGNNLGSQAEKQCFLVTAEGFMPLQYIKKRNLLNKTFFFFFLVTKMLKKKSKGKKYIWKLFRKWI